jgi:hypothetical protein
MKGQLARLLVAMLSSMTLLLAAFAQASANPAKRRFTVSDEIGLSHFGDPYTGKTDAVTFSPDGRYFIVATERGVIESNRSESTLRVFRAEDVHQFLVQHKMTGEPSPVWIFSKSTFKDGPIITSIRWLADSSGIAFLAKTPVGDGQLLLGDLRTKSVEALTQENQDVISFDVRDRDHFVYSVKSAAIRDEAIQEQQTTTVAATGRFLYSLIFPQNLYASMSQFYDLSELWAFINGRRFRITDERSGRPLALHSAGNRTLALSPDGHSIVTALPVASVPREWETLYPPSLPSSPYRFRSGPQDVEALDGYGFVSEYVLIHLSTGKVTPLINAPIGEGAGWWSILSADWSSDSKSVVLSNTFVPSSAHDPHGRLDRPCVAVVELVNDKVTCLERLKGLAKTKSGIEEGFRYILGVHFAPGSSERVTFEYREWSDATKRSLSYMRSVDGSWNVVPTKNGWFEEDRQIEAEVKESFSNPPVLLATDKTTKTSRVILDPNPQLRDIDLGEVSIYKWKDKANRDWVGGLYKPPNYVHGQRYPLVVQTHGFVESIFRPSGIFPTAFAARELAATGIFVLQANDCPPLADAEEGPCSVAAYKAGVEQLVKDGLVDMGRVGIIGFSRSCYYVMEALTTSKFRLKAASITDGVNFGYLQYMTMADLSGNHIAHEAVGVNGAPPVGEGLQQWFKRSPGFNMEKVTAPLQVVALGRRDVLFMWEPYAALRYLNRPVDLIVLNSDEHVLSNPNARLASQGGTVDWFRFWLQEYEDPDPAKTEQYKRWRELRKLQGENEKKTTASQPAPN